MDEKKIMIHTKQSQQKCKIIENKHRNNEIKKTHRKNYVILQFQFDSTDRKKRHMLQEMETIAIFKSSFKCW